MGYSFLAYVPAHIYRLYFFSTNTHTHLIRAHLSSVSPVDACVPVSMILWHSDASHNTFHRDATVHNTSAQPRRQRCRANATLRCETLLILHTEKIINASERTELLGFSHREQKCLCVARRTKLPSPCTGTVKCCNWFIPLDFSC